ncbi:hypothetical protein GDO86_015283 [Hymenochirus boettgeri]|uniref:Uncharacterized protein n=1 Tax=Hymenochirus boettgeri TaxID=247094 RepID=A0A8T2JSB8_9PIPI|nr:hypothetical protein GDO86_015283 [Hymenochirus boettgeri]
MGALRPQSVTYDTCWKLIMQIFACKIYITLLISWGYNEQSQQQPKCALYKCDVTLLLEGPVLFSLYASFIDLCVQEADPSDYSVFIKIMCYTNEPIRIRP